jgi:1-aminocyclopropane-1-carboxylate deaminase/D-cysteine desulfhydrase-like pyridoxal-dependent ACC family enzyme
MAKRSAVRQQGKRSTGSASVLTPNTLEASRIASMSLAFGNYPTPFWRAHSLQTELHDVWVKDDGKTAAVYGGNKVRKLERLLDAATRRKATRVLTVGAAGSHHVLATCLFGKQVGLATAALLLPQPWTPHAEGVLRAGLKAGLEPIPCTSPVAAIRSFWRHRRSQDYVVGPGGMGFEGTSAYAAAAHEALEQAREAGVAPIDRIFVAAGSGSTAAGLLAGVLEAKAPTRIVAVQVAGNLALRAVIMGQALYVLLRRGIPIEPLRMWRALHIERRFVGGGYGHATPESESASELARSFGLELDPTYTAKAFAALLRAITQRNWSERAGKLGLRRRQTYLYWHTLSSAPLTALLEGAPLALPSELAELLPKPRPSVGASALG